ncbi:hypothetical protein, partial [Citrobacter youngae]|uniref:hypothetical protein n=1 Tax=Citrobacter youngae TaxID=133448 RepID=UPI00195387AB
MNSSSIALAIGSVLPLVDLVAISVWRASSTACLGRTRPVGKVGIGSYAMVWCEKGKPIELE